MTAAMIGIDRSCSMESTYCSETVATLTYDAPLLLPILKEHPYRSPYSLGTPQLLVDVTPNAHARGGATTSGRALR
jgi:hypothetical protein